MKTENIIQEKSYKFALRIVKLYKYLIEKQKIFPLANQILKSGTSIGANVEEGIGAQSKKDFFAKFTIAYKEARETKFWLRLLKDSDLLEKTIANSLLEDCEEILKILGKIQTTFRKKNHS